MFCAHEKHIDNDEIMIMMCAVSVAWPFFKIDSICMHACLKLENLTQEKISVLNEHWKLQLLLPRQLKGTAPSIATRHHASRATGKTIGGKINYFTYVRTCEQAHSVQIFTSVFTKQVHDFHILLLINRSSSDISFLCKKSQFNYLVYNSMT